ncbi:MAG: LuxR C-terminal-related transcriptional regulator [Candidatus Sphingomonas colombiensis]|nr:LuxR family transcriptional regulator [Sphingomonas sp.]WEK42445.1 MAG: LuxR C-terminal-related transcriptional regulator [Sphingomonas sp.]
MNVGSMPELSWEVVDRLALSVVAAGRDAGFPYVAAQSDLGDPAPMTDGEGRAYAESLPWVDSDPYYWRNRALALRSSFLLAARVFAEPIWFAGGKLGSWRPTQSLKAIDCSRVTDEFGFTGAIIAPAHLAGGQVGAVVWVTTAPIDMPAIFAAHAADMFTTALQFLAAHSELVTHRQRVTPATLSPREAQCVRWAAAGKTNAEIATILSLSVSTVRFHLRNAGEKLGATTRSRMIQLATGMGFLGRHV